jgi:hypothetical protein
MIIGRRTPTASPVVNGFSRRQLDDAVGFDRVARRPDDKLQYCKGVRELHEDIRLHK